MGGGAVGYRGRCLGKPKEGGGAMRLRSPGVVVGVGVGVDQAGRCS